MRILEDLRHLPNLIDFVFWRILNDAIRINPEKRQTESSCDLDCVTNGLGLISLDNTIEISGPILRGKFVELLTTPAVAQGCILS
jgi:hypothetical protein